MTLEAFTVKPLAWVVGILFSEVIADFLLVETKNHRFKMRFNLNALNPFINHDKAITAYIIQLLCVALFASVLEDYFVTLLSKTTAYYLPIVFLTSTSFYILAIKKLSIKMNRGRWFAFGILFLVTVVSFYIVHKFFVN